MINIDIYNDKTNAQAQVLAYIESGLSASIFQSNGLSVIKRFKDTDEEELMDEGDNMWVVMAY